ncbi:MAG: hypothetical protein HS122_12940 [Opitutaceae bacterium]|nr:hypothetical protein [Opitutaceae bacterium]
MMTLSRWGLAQLPVGENTVDQTEYDPLKEITTQSTGVSGGRTESVAVRVPGGAASTISRTYADSSAGEILTAETVGTSNALTGSFLLHNSERGNTGQTDLGRAWNRRMGGQRLLNLPRLRHGETNVQALSRFTGDRH